MSTKPVLTWPGGKQKLLKHLLPIPPHECYVELFAGGLAMLLAKEPSGVEVVCDTHADLVNLYRCARFHGEELDRELRLRINSRRDFQHARQHPGATDIQRAANWLFVAALCFGGEAASFGVVRKSGGGACTSMIKIREKLATLSARLERVIIEDIGWQRCLALYDSPDTLFFAEPPYVGGKIKLYSAWTQAQMTELASALRGIRGNWLVTVNDSPENRAAFAFGHITSFVRAHGVANRRAEDRRGFGELVVRKQLR